MDNIPPNSPDALAPLSSENLQQETVKTFNFNGDSNTLFYIYIVNALYTILSLGLYYPWAKAKLMQYNYGETEFMGSRFVFHGTGREMFMGFLRAGLIIGAIYGGVTLLQYFGFSLVGTLLLFVGYLLLLPLVIYGTVRYRASRSSWRGMYFQYVGSIKNMYKVAGLGFLYTLLTIGIYSSWLRVDLYKEILGNLRLGNIRFKFTGTGGFYFGQNLILGLLFYLTLGIYYFRYSAEVFNYSVSNIRLHQDHLTLKGTLKAKVTGMDMFKLKFVNFLIIVFSLGLATPVAIVRTMNFYAAHITMLGSVNFNAIEQTDINLSTGAGAEGMFDAFDMDLQLI